LGGASASAGVARNASNQNIIAEIRKALSYFP
jgi:hypothetical protein